MLNMTIMSADTDPVVMDDKCPIVLQQGLSFDWSDVAVQTIKYKKFTDKLFDSLPQQAQHVVWSMMGFAPRGFNNTLLDFKVKELDTGDCGCFLEDWHMDVTRNPKHPSRPDYHLIYTTVVGTEFMLDRLHQDVEDFSNLILSDEPEVWQAPANSIVLFTRYNLHRGPVVQYPCKRVLIRMTYTDII